MKTSSKKCENKPIVAILVLRAALRTTAHFHRCRFDQTKPNHKHFKDIPMTRPPRIEYIIGADAIDAMSIDWSESIPKGGYMIRSLFR
jgi:hypothetical protein